MTTPSAAQAGGSKQLLGTARAESDTAMLDVAFVETADFDLLRGGPNHNFVVGRRGAGKSALFLRLVADFRAERNVVVVAIRPDEFEMKGLIAALRRRMPNSPEYSSVKSLTRVVWRAVLAMQVAQKLVRAGVDPGGKLEVLVASCAWLKKNPMESVRNLLDTLPDNADPDEAVYRAAKFSELEVVEELVRTALADSGRRALVFVDGLDEGWRSHPLEVGMVGGLCAASVDFHDRSTGVRVLVFLRDNIFRILGEWDGDFSRNIAGDNVRLTWNHNTLFQVIVRRLRAVNSISDDVTPTAVWNRFAKQELKGIAGFTECLRHTLYRPRDALELLNLAIHTAQRKGRAEIIVEDVAESALEISRWRLDDLFKEYGDVFPGLKQYVEAFSGRPSIDTLESVLDLLNARRETFDADGRRTFATLGTAANVFQSLFGMGFLGLELSGSGFQFCHDGADIASKELPHDCRVAVHPCYARALDVVVVPGTSFDVLLAANDDYDEEPADTESIARLLRDGARSLAARLPAVPLGHDGASAFEEWTRDVVTILCDNDLVNLQLHPNGDAPLRRDLVGANEGRNGLWRRMQSSYGANQVIFEIKNFDALGPDAYQQARAYMGGAYGRLAFIVYRSMRDALDPNERSHVQAHFSQGGLLVLIPAELLQRCLKKTLQQANTKYARRKLSDWVDKHERSYVNPPAGRRS